MKDRTPRVGDTAHVSLEGKVLEITEDWFSVGTPENRNRVYFNADHVRALIVIPRPLQVGDVVCSKLDPEPPVGTVLDESKPPFGIAVRGNAGWTTTASPLLHHWGQLDLPRTVLKVGDGK